MTRQQIDVVSLAAIDFDVALLEAAAKDLADSHAHDADLVQGFLQFFQFTGTGNDFYFGKCMFFHLDHLYIV